MSSSLLSFSGQRVVEINRCKYIPQLHRSYPCMVSALMSVGQCVLKSSMLTGGLDSKIPGSSSANVGPSSYERQIVDMATAK